MEKAEVFLGLQEFLDRMRQPSAADIVKSIKSFIVSFSHNPPDPERDSAAVQDFLSNMEATFRAHPLWAGCSEEDLDSAGEGLEKYVMTKLFMRVFGSHPDDVKLDEELSEKMALVQQFIHPENLDIKSSFLNETSLLLAQKELQKINACKAPRDKLVCIINCCKAINNLLFNASNASNENPPGADEFLPVLIFVTIKANPPQLHSNLAFIQRYRRKSCLVAEAAYVFTNMLSAESFISNIDAKALSMDESEFEKNMESARALLCGLSAENDNLSNSIDQMEDSIHKSEVREQTRKASGFDRIPVTPPKTLEAQLKTNISNSKEQQITKIPSLSDLENKGATLLLKEEQVSKIFKDYPYLYATAGDLTVNDVEDLLNYYKQIVFKYVSLAKGMGVDPPSSSKLQTESPAPAESREFSEASQNLNINHELQDTDKTDDRVSLNEEEELNTNSPQKEFLAS